MYVRYWPYALAFLAGSAFTVLILIAWHYGRAPAREDLPPRVDLSIVDGETYRVARVVDGDTIVLENGLHIRYAGANTPEKGRFVQDVAPLALEATERNRELVEGKLVRLKLAGTPLDAHGRVVARITVAAANGAELDVEAALLKEGLARAMGLGLPTGEYQRLKTLEDEAKAARAGIWGLTHPLETGKPAAFPFCAASGGKVFHRVDCPQAGRLSAANFIGFAELDKALASGRKPCSQCLKNQTTAPAKEASPDNGN
jgi:micrococcal nuclease